MKKVNTEDQLFKRKETKQFSASTQSMIQEIQNNKDTYDHLYKNFLKVVKELEKNYDQLEFSPTQKIIQNTKEGEIDLTISYRNSYIVIQFIVRQNVINSQYTFSNFKIQQMKPSHQIERLQNLLNLIRKIDNQQQKYNDYGQYFYDFINYCPIFSKDYQRKDIYIEDLITQFTKMAQQNNIFVPYPAPGNLCWSPKGFLNIAQNQHYNIINIINKKPKMKEIRSSEQLTKYYESIRKQIKDEGNLLIAQQTSSQFLIIDDVEDEEFKLDFDYESDYNNDQQDSQFNYLNIILQTQNGDKQQVDQSQDQNEKKIFKEGFINVLSEDELPLYEKFSNLLKICTQQQKNRKISNLINYLQFYDFQKYCLVDENKIIKFINSYNLNYSSFKNEKFFIDVISNYQSNHYLSKIIRQLTQQIPEYNKQILKNLPVVQKLHQDKIFFAFDAQFMTIITLFMNYLQSKNKITIKNIFKIFLFQTFTNFTKIREKYLQILSQFYNNLSSSDENKQKVKKAINSLIDESNIYNQTIFNDCNKLIQKILFDMKQKNKQDFQFNQVNQIYQQNRQSFDSEKKQYKPKQNFQMEKKFVLTNYYKIQKLNLTNIFESLQINNIHQKFSKILKNLFRIQKIVEYHILKKILNFDNIQQKNAFQVNQILEMLDNYDHKYVQNTMNIEQKKENQNDIVNCSVCDVKVQNQILFCSKCFHGGHFDHLQQWFSKNEFCPKCFNCKCFTIKN